MRLVTLTLHPTIDRVLEIKALKPGATFDARLLMTVPAGKGVNTARVLRCLCQERQPIVAAAWIGEGEKEWFARQLAVLSGIRAALCPRPCFTRYASTLLEQSGRETHIKERMPAVTRAEETALLAYWRTVVRGGDIVALCGSAPARTSAETLREVYSVARRNGARTIVADGSGVALSVAGAAGLDGLKGNAAEIGAWLGLRRPFNAAQRAHREALVAAFARKGAPRAIMITLGAGGALLAANGSLWRATPPQIGRAASPAGVAGLQSATGCGDAATAGWVWALRDKCSAEETLRRAVACGTAKLASADPGRVDRRYVLRLRAAMTVTGIRL
ncbi:MAG: PfkB family carbohydrate kinase [Planctomycetota bacterium]|nr:PfkB family carbohydrate kinase [Planctomycetota bacterium]